MDKLNAIAMTVWYGYAGSGKFGWWAECYWQDDKFCEPKAVEGKIYTRYAEETLPGAIDTVLEVVEKFGLKPFDQFSLFYKDDGNNKNYPPPRDWEKILKEEADKRNWGSY